MIFEDKENIGIEIILKAITFILRIAGFSFMILPSVMLCLISADQFVCQRSKNLCEFKERHIWQSEYTIEKVVALSDIHNAYIESHLNDRGSTLYQVYLNTQKGAFPLSNKSISNYDFQSETKAKINSYLKSNQESLEITGSNLWFLFPFLFIVIGFFVAFILPIIISRIYRKKRNIDIGIQKCF
jgi:hypothetical protein